MRLLGLDLEFRNSHSSLVTRGSLADSDLTNPQEWLLNALGASASATGITVTPLKALGVACVFACVRVLCDTISTLPLEVHQRQGRKRRAATDHPLWNAFTLEPNEEMTTADWRWAVQSQICLSPKAAGFSEILRNGDGDVSGFYPVESNRVDFDRNPLSRKLRYRVTREDNNPLGSVVLRPRDMVHIKGNTFNGLTGLGTVSAARECIALAMALQDNAAKFFGNGSRPGGVLKHPASLSTPAQDRLKNQFESQVGGKNLYRMLVLEEGLEYIATRSENRDSQFIEAKDAQNLEICRLWGVPPHKVGIQNSQPRANIEEENIAFVMDRIRPECVKHELELTRKAFTLEERDQGYCAYFDLDALMRGNSKVRYETYSIGRQWGILTANDCRARENLDDVEGGDILLQPINMIDSSKATEYLMSANKEPEQSEGGLGGKPNAKTQ
jgi:HK97 family phage portal protein